jgi:HEAT repeat protein
LQNLRKNLLIDLVRMSRGLPPLHGLPTSRQVQIPGQLLLLQKQLHRRQELVAREQLGDLLRALSDRKEFLDGLFQEMVRQEPEELKSRLEDKEPDIRLVATQAIADRRLHFEESLIDLLNDPSKEVQQAAQQALVRLSRGNNFSQDARAWHQWLLWQDIPGQPSPGWLAQKLRDGPPDLQKWLFAQLRDWHREDGTSILACTIPLLAPVSEPANDSQEAEPKGPSKTNAEEVADTPQDRLRRVLAGRLSKLSATALEDSLKGSNAEIRRAAASACALRKDKGHVPALVEALKDAEAAVSQAAHDALRELTGQDFGPPPGGDRARIESAAAAWLRWWQSQPQAASEAK